MKKIFLFMAVVMTASVYAQNIFPPSGRAGIYTTSPGASLQVKGGALIGTAANYMSIDSATGNLSFAGTAGYRVANNTFAFSAAGAPSAGLYFNATNVRYEFRNTSGVPAVIIGADANGFVGIGTSTPGAKLEVAGDALLNGITVGQGGGNISYNTAVGRIALASNTTGSGNTAVAINALTSNTTGSYNTAIGLGTLQSNTIGSTNTALGVNVLPSNSTGNNNVGLGPNALVANTTGSNNIGVGFSAAFKNTVGNYNIGIGFNALLTNDTGSNNMAIGAFADVNAGGLTNATAIGYNAHVSASNSIVLGNNANVGIGASAPAAKLDVAGNVKIADGTQGAGKVLTSDASGLASWTTPGATPWSVSGNKIYSIVGDSVGIGTTTPGTNLEVSSSNTTGYATGLKVGAPNLAANASTLITQGKNTSSTGNQAEYRFDYFGDDNLLNSHSFGFNNVQPFVYFTAGSKVGIGTNAPFTQLANTTTNVIAADGYGVSSRSLLWQSSGIGYAAAFYNPSSSSSSGGVIVKIHGNTGTVLDLSASDSVSVMSVKGNGNVGIGTANPTRPFVVKNSSTTANAEVSELASAIGDTTFHLIATKGVTTNASGDAMVKFGMVYGNVGSSTKSAMIRFHRGLAGNDGAISFSTNNDATEIMRLTNAGRIGIGTTVPGGQFELSLDQGRKPGTSTWTITSDARLKNIDGNYTKGLKEILQLKPIAYHYKNVNNRKFDAKTLAAPAVGFTAQDVQKVFPECVSTDEDGYLNLNIHAIIIAQVNAIQELAKQNDALKTGNEDLKSTINKQQQQINAILQKLDDLQSAQQACCDRASAAQTGTSQAISLSSSNASLLQNAPNPFSSTTVIRYTLPQHVSNAQILITDLKGSTIKSTTVSTSGSLTVAAGSLASGTYKYSLLVDGRLIDTKTMIITQ